jgi:hypothetical protein
MSTYLCPSCQGRREVGVSPTFGDTAFATSATTCLTCGGTGSIGPQWAYIAVCPYCGTERDTDVVNAAGECPTVSCCGETHCVDKRHPSLREEYENF